MKYTDLCKEAQEYIERFAKKNNLTIEDAMKHMIVSEVLKSMEEDE